MTTSEKSTGISPSFKNVRDTSATPDARRDALPVKMMSSAFVPRRLRTFCSPKTQRTASVILLLPLPFGPTTAVTPRSNSISMRSAKDLKP